MNILILGSEGFIGHHLVAYFTSKQENVFGCDLFEAATQSYQYQKVSRLSPELEDVFSNTLFDFCINAAGSGNVNYSMTHPVSDFEANDLDTIRVLDYIRKLQPGCRFIHISSAAVYGNPLRLPITESDPAAPLSPYGWHKYISELICREYHQLFGVRSVILRPFSVYGEGLKKQLLWDLCNKINAGKNVELFGTGNESRDFIHVKDLVFAIDCIMRQAAFESEVYNVADGTETTIQTLATIFENNFSNGCSIRFTGQKREGDPINWCADVQKLTGTGFAPKIQLGEGVINYIRWYQSLHMPAGIN